MRQSDAELYEMGLTDWNDGQTDVFQLGQPQFFFYMRGCILISFVLALLPLSGFCQNILTLDDCIKTALENNLELQKMQIRAAQGRVEFIRTAMEATPSLGADASAGKSFSKGADPISTVGLNLDASLSVSLGLSHYFRSKSAEAAYTSSGYEMLSAQKELEEQVTEAFLDVIVAKEALVFAKNNLETLRGQLSNARLLFEAGRRSAGALAEICAEELAAEAKLGEAESGLSSCILKLTSVMGIRFDRNMEFEPPTFEYKMLPDSSESYYSVAIRLAKAHPATLAMARSEESARYALKASVGNLFPTLTIGGSYGSSWYGYSDRKWQDRLKDNISSGLNLTLSIPLFSSFQAQSAIKSGKLAAEAASIATKITGKQVSERILSLLVEAEGCRNQLFLAQKSCRAYEELARENEEKFAAGSLTATEYSAVLAKYRLAYFELSRKKWQYYLILKIIELYSDE